MHKITFFSKSQPRLYSQNILKTDKMYSDKTNVFASNIMFKFEVLSASYLTSEYRHLSPMRGTCIGRLR